MLQPVCPVYLKLHVISVSGNMTEKLWNEPVVAKLEIKFYPFCFFEDILAGVPSEIRIKRTHYGQNIGFPLIL